MGEASPQQISINCEMRKYRPSQGSGQGVTNSALVLGETVEDGNMGESLKHMHLFSLMHNFKLELSL